MRLGMPPELATLADFAAIIASLGDFWGERDVRALHHPMFVREFGDTALVIRDGSGLVLAYLFGFLSPSRVGYIHVIGVRIGHQRRGLGRQLYAEFERLARDRGAVALKAISGPANQASIAFHHSLGMSDTEVADYSGEGQTRLIFWRDLDTPGTA
jgi:L-amino acid N-acyltransferase YncA